jgi:hypothetical protein
MKNFRLFSWLKSIPMFLWAKLCAVLHIRRREQETKILVSRAEVQPPPDDREVQDRGKRRSGRSRKRHKQKGSKRRQRRSPRTGKARRSRRHEGRSRTKCTRSDRRRANERHRRRRDRERRIAAMEGKPAAAVASA